MATYTIEFEFSSTRADGDTYTVTRRVDAKNAAAAMALVPICAGFAEFGERFTENCIDWRIKAGA